MSTIGREMRLLSRPLINLPAIYSATRKVLGTIIVRSYKTAMMQYFFFLILVFIAPYFGFNQVSYDQDIRVAASRTEDYLHMLEGKQVAIVGNQTSLVGEVHLVDSLVSAGIDVRKVFALEHGFRGDADAGAVIRDGKDSKTGIPVISLYGNSKKPKPEHLNDVDVVVFDLQDVGARFYTYISSMHYIMEACAENKTAFIVLDRPNPNGHYVDGPVLDIKFQSFIGMHPVPIVHGMTIGEFAQMINGEGWLQNGVKADLKVVECANYSHTKFYEVPVRPSPNLPNMSSIYLYPTLCLFEGTTLSVGRGTDRPFQFVGAPGFPEGNIALTPQVMPGATKPKHLGVPCKGYDLQDFGFNVMRGVKQVYLHWLVGMYRDHPDQANFFKTTGSFNLLCGTDRIRQMIEQGKSAEQIMASWKDDIDAFKKIRKKYLLYPDFE